METFLSN